EIGPAGMLRRIGSAKPVSAGGTRRLLRTFAALSPPTKATSPRWSRSRRRVRYSATSLDRMSRPVVLVAEALPPSALAVLSGDFEVRTVDGADRAALLPALADVDAVIVRSATHIDAEALASADKLKVVARAGVGLDNVDVPAATARGVLVVNAPTSNIVSAAEHAIALLLAVARRVPQAATSLRAGEWKRSKYTGIEVVDKTMGVVGLGRIGVLVAQRMSAFGVRLLAYDPYVPAARAAQIDVRLVPLEELLRESDFI